MKALQLLGLNHRLRFEVPEGGALVVVRHPQRRVHLHFDFDNGGQAEMDCGTACGIDRTSSDVFPLPIKVYDMDEAALGMHCVANTDHGAIKSMIDTLQGLGVEAKREAIEPSLVRGILHGVSEAAQAERPLPITEEQRLGAMQFYGGMLTDMIVAAMRGGRLELQQINAGDGEEDEEGG